MTLIAVEVPEIGRAPLVTDGTQYLIPSDVQSQMLEYLLSKQAQSNKCNKHLRKHGATTAVSIHKT